MSATDIYIQWFLYMSETLMICFLLAAIVRKYLLEALETGNRYLPWMLCFWVLCILGMAWSFAVL